MILEISAQRDSNINEGHAEVSLYQRIMRSTFSRLREEIEDMKYEASTEPTECWGRTIQNR